MNKIIISAKEGDASYSPLCNSSNLKVFFNGYRIENVVFADEVNGSVRVLSTKPNGTYLVVNGQIKQKTLNGKVEITGITEQERVEHIRAVSRNG